MNTEILAISADSLESHAQFSEKLGGVPFPMLSDEDGRVIRLYGVAKEEGNRARRSVFVLDSQMTVIHANTEYSVANPDHYEAIFQPLQD